MPVSQSVLCRRVNRRELFLSRRFRLFLALLLTLMITTISQTCRVSAFRPSGSCAASSTRMHSSQSNDIQSEPLPSPPPLILRGSKPIKTVMAPMVAQSDAAFRLLGRRHGCDLCFTQMIHAKQVTQSDAFRKNHVDVWPPGTILPELLHAQKNCLQGLPYSERPSTPWDEKGPVVVQLAGHEPQLMVEAAHRIREQSQDSVDGFDINLGCPQGIARKGRYGAFLAEEEGGTDLVCEILRALRKSIPDDIAISAKIRIPPNEEELNERVLRLMDTGISFLTVHGRTVHENKTRIGPSKTHLIRQVVDVLQEENPSFPVIANGGVESFEDVERLLTETKASAIMSSEALLENPALFEASIMDLSSRELLQRQLAISREYIDLCEQFPPVPGSLGQEHGSFNVIKTHLFKLVHRYLQASSDLREELSDNGTTTIIRAREILHKIEEEFGDMSDEELTNHRASQNSASWYRRHWKAAATARVKTRGDAYFRKAPVVSVEERKRQAKERIERLRLDRELKENQGISM